MCEGIIIKKDSNSSNTMMNQLEFFKKLNFLKPQEPAAHNVFGCFCLILCLIFGLFMLDYKIVKGSLLTTLFKFNVTSNLADNKATLFEFNVSSYSPPPPPPPLVGVGDGDGRPNSSSPLVGDGDGKANSSFSAPPPLVGDGNGKPKPKPEPKQDFLEMGNGDCDVFDGKWVWDESYPLYESQDCMFLDEGFRCTENGRPDKLYTKWRWQPNACNLPRFNATLMLETLRNKRLVFVGDSIGRNQWESFLCMLSSVVPNKTSIYEVNGSPITKHMGYLLFRFREFNCTVEYYRAPFLVLQSRAPARAPKNVSLTIKLDQMDWSSNRWKGADILVFNSGHWWNAEKTVKVGCYFQEGAKVKMEMSIEHAFQRSLKTVLNWINREVDLSKTQLVFRTYSPVHFSGGDWNTGGGCQLENLPDFTTPPKLSETSIEFKTVVNGLSKHMKMGNIDLLNITAMTSQRKDGHASMYYLGPATGPAPLFRQDCSHWCLPGIPDTWNELLYAIIMKRQVSGK